MHFHLMQMDSLLHLLFDDKDQFTLDHGVQFVKHQLGAFLQSLRYS